MDGTASPADTAIDILLVEDNPGDADLVAEYLADADVPGVATSLRHVDRVAAAIASLRGRQPDVILLDLLLPDADGLDAVHAVRSAAPGVPIVVLTGMARHALAIDAVRRGAQDYLLKGRFDGDSLLRAIRYAIERERTQRALRASEELIRTALAAAPIGMALSDLDGRWRTVNRALCEMTGYTEAELLARSFRDITHPDDVAADVAHMERLLAGDTRSYELEKRYIRKDGALVWVLLCRSLVRGDAGEPRYFIAQIQEVTARKRAAERTQQLLAVTTGLTAARTPVDVATRIATQGVESLGASLVAVAIVVPDGRELRMLAGAGVPDAVRHRWARLPVSAPEPMADVVRDGRPVWLESATQIAAAYQGLDGRRALPPVDAMAVLPLALGDERIGALAIGYPAPNAARVAGGPTTFDADDRALLQAVAHQGALALDRARLYEAERDASAAARSASEAQSRFLAVTSHELRTPLNSVLGFAELVAEGLAGPVTETQRSHLARVRASANHLLTMIDDLLVLSRVAAGREATHVQRVRVNAIVREVAAQFAPALEDKGLVLALELADGEPSVASDRSKLRHILVNLLGNAVKFTERRDGQPGRVAVRVLANGPMLAVEVEDTGIGIAEEHLARVFDPFWQVDQRTRRPVGGAGLGLDVSLRLARLLGGDLRVRSVLGAGSTFTVVLPRGGASLAGASLAGASLAGVPGADVSRAADSPGPV